MFDRIFCKYCKTEYSGKYDQMSDLVVYDCLRGVYESFCPNCEGSCFTTHDGYVIPNSKPNQDQLVQLIRSTKHEE